MSCDEIWRERAKEYPLKIPKSPEAGVLVDFVTELRPLKVLEVGSNYGRELKYLEGLAELHGIDSCQEMIENARRYIPMGSFSIADAESLPYRDNSIDFVYTCGLLAHLVSDSAKRTLEEIFRVSSTYVLLMEYLGTRMSRTGISNCKSNSYVHDYERMVVHADESIKFMRKMFFGMDWFMVLLLKKNVIEEKVVIEEAKLPKFMFKIGRFKLGV